MSSNAFNRDTRPRVRVYLPTYRRGVLLRSAMESLLAQTITDWVCELHNDDPSDRAPSELVKALGDRRVQLIEHERNLGPTATFNLFFRGCAEPFYCILEDDNVWDADFLETMLAAATDYPAATVFWANMRIRVEQVDGSFETTGQCIHPYSQGERPREVSWGQRSQLFGSLHSNGAMLVRSRPGQSFIVPDVPFSAVETFRDRMFPHPLIFVPRPLAAFSQTRSTARSDDRAEWAEMQALFACSFLRATKLDHSASEKLYRESRGAQPPMHRSLLWAGLLEPACRNLLGSATAADWLEFCAHALWRPSVTLRLLRSRRRHGDWWEFICRHTDERQREASTSR